MAEGIIPGLVGEHHFRVEVHRTAQVIGSGSHTRVIMDVARFRASLDKPRRTGL